MKLKVSWIIGGIIAFLLFAIAYMPAVHVIGRIALPSNVAVSGVSGTLFSGKAQTVVVNGLPIKNVKWELSPLHMLIGKIKLNLKAGNIRDKNDIAFEGPITTGLFSQNSVNTENFTLYLPVDRVLAQVRLPLPVNAGGRFKVSLSDLTFGPACQSLNGTGDWLNATVAGTQGPIDFGTYSAKLRCEGDDIGILVSEPNLLSLSMDAVIPTTMKNIRVSGKFKPDDSLPQEVHQAARLFGAPDRSGYIAIKL
ncbi:type II secretion system protein N [Alteromonas sp. KUL17]|uniref:type II secretion system protein N n=1 Tax=Alteromonas sp. KUL17 TaxID=2480796 RepID=UPI0010371158|nr:type II secretion system protein N [Alteromonas sp. KUL17]TAP22355.1 type II secretion system protein N [Alteromonas sp. KUL17]GEA04627.1 type II secretion system protein N [Alteromonas sp. KUL17]